MKRYVIMDASICGNPVYVAESEADAARWLDELEAKLRKQGRTLERPNSLTLRKTGERDYGQYTTLACPSWEPEPLPVPEEWKPTTTTVVQEQP